MLHDKITQVSLAFSKLNGWLNLFVHRGTFYHIRSNFVVRHNCVLAMFTDAVDSYLRVCQRLFGLCGLTWHRKVVVQTKFI